MKLTFTFAIVLLVGIMTYYITKQQKEIDGLHKQLQLVVQLHNEKNHSLHECVGKLEYENDWKQELKKKFPVDFKNLKTEGE